MLEKSETVRKSKESYTKCTSNEGPDCFGEIWGKLGRSREVRNVKKVIPDLHKAMGAIKLSGERKKENVRKLLESEEK